MYFTGADLLNLDAKGRLMMPTAHRDALVELCNGELMITRHWMEKKCLLVLPMPKWNQVLNEIIGNPTFDKTTQMTMRLILGNAKPVKLDSNNRILIPPNLREAVGLEKAVQLMGLGEKFELWPGVEIESVENDWYDKVQNMDLDKIPEHIKKLAL